MIESGVSEQEQEQAEQEQREQAARDAWGAAWAAFYAFVIALLTILGRAVQALFTLLRFALPVFAAALQVVGAVLLFGSVTVAYGGDLPALLLALAFVSIVPVVLVMLARDALDIWGILVASGALSWLAALGIARSPPTLLGALPGLGLLACIFWLTFGAKSPDAQTQGVDNGRE